MALVFDETAAAAEVAADRARYAPLEGVIRDALGDPPATVIDVLPLYFRTDAWASACTAADRLCAVGGLGRYATATGRRAAIAVTADGRDLALVYHVTSLLALSKMDLVVEMAIADLIDVARIARWPAALQVIHAMAKTGGRMKRRGEKKQRGQTGTRIEDLMAHTAGLILVGPLAANLLLGQEPNPSERVQVVTGDLRAMAHRLPGARCNVAAPEYPAGDSRLRRLSCSVGTAAIDAYNMSEYALVPAMPNHLGRKAWVGTPLLVAHLLLADAWIVWGLAEKGRVTTEYAEQVHRRVWDTVRALCAVALAGDPADQLPTASELLLGAAQDADLEARRTQPGRFYFPAEKK